MKQGLSQSLKLGQELRINPRLYQAMDMLTMPLLDLQQHLKTELQQNPFLDLVEPDEDDEENAAEPASAGADEQPVELADPAPSEEENAPWEDLILEGFEEGSRGLSAPADTSEFPDPVRVAVTSLADHLREQVSLLDLTERQEALADEFIGNIDDDGYLACTLEELLDALNETIRQHARSSGMDDDDAPVFTMDEATQMLAIIQRLDPPGVGARDVRECLLLQLTDLGRRESLAWRLVDEAFDELIARKWTELARRFGVTPADVQAASDEIARLDPKPGLRHGTDDDGFVTPDLIVERIDGEYRVFTNDVQMPRLRLSRSYEDLARDRKNLDAEQRDFIQSRMNAAHWLVQAIEQRRQTMLKVMHYIVDRQREFFDKGVEHLRPMTLREVAEVVGLHESTVSRVTSDKYVQTPRGILPLKFFFSSGLSTTDGEDVSARGIRAQIGKLIGAEDPRKPLTDQEIVQHLQRSGVNIARRTVAKYREQLRLQPARMRKRV